MAATMRSMRFGETTVRSYNYSMLGSGIRCLPKLFRPVASPPAVHTSKRFLVSRKQRRKFERTGELKLRGAGTQKAIDARLAAEEPATLYEAISQQKVKFNPFLFLGVAPLIAWAILITTKPELREQMNQKWRETRSAFFSVQEDGDGEATPQLVVDSSRSSSEQPK
jgi:hypothetical protein